ncbi:MAG: bifunctional diaminohydroxyphosphoribosylaminopyrimidine deaminase/5-amino-6-(5-phosphoribosylamino)uracil reductase RibD [Pseudomonadota bacterium]
MNGTLEQGRAADRLYLRSTIELAERGRFTCAPNPTVGCVIVRRGQVLGRGWHQYTGQGHAEANAIADAGNDIRGATVYVSLEPCSFVGRTPACAATLVEHNVARVVIAQLDPHPLVSGEGVRMLQRAGIEVDVMELDEARAVIAGYIKRVTLKRPLVRIKSASSLDGATALADGQSQWITGPEARVDVQAWRARADAIITGIGTVLADDPALTVREQSLEPFAQPLRVVLDRGLRTPSVCQVVKDRQSTLIVHEQSAVVPDHLLAAESVELLSQPAIDLGSVLEALGERGCNEVLVEAGAQVVGSFVEAGLWDEWVAYLAPRILGRNTRGIADFVLNDLAAAPSCRLADITRVGEDIRITLERVGG